MSIAMIRIVFLPMILLVLAFAAMGIGLLLAKPSTRRVLLWILGAVILAAVFLFPLLLLYKGKSIPSVETDQPIVLSQSIAEVPSVWRDEIEREFDTEVYSSLQAAAYGLGKQVADKHKDLFRRELEVIQDPQAQSKSTGPKKIMLCEDTINPELLQAFRDGFKHSFPDMDTVVATRPTSGLSEGYIWILFERQEETQPVFRQELKRSGYIEAVIYTPDEKTSQRVRYDYRPWIHETPAMQAKYGGQIMIVFSDTATDLEAAQKQVYDKACSTLIQSITASGRQPTDIQREKLEQFGMVADTYSQELTGMTGPVWRFALLLDVGSEKLNELVQGKHQVVACQRNNSWAQMGLSLLGMIVVIWIAYSVANATTKGYNSVLLAILAIVAAAVVGLLLCTA